MNKATVLIIGVVYLASIVLISLLGLNSVIAQPNIPVTRIECTGATGSDVSESTYTTNGNTYQLFSLRFTEVGGYDDNGQPTGTYVQLSYRVYPDNASNKVIRIVVSNASDSAYELIKLPSGEDLGLIFIKRRATLIVDLISTDGSNVSTRVYIDAY